MGHSPSVAASNARIFTDHQNPQLHDFDWPFAAPATSIKNAVMIHPLLILLNMCSLLQRENELPNPLRRTYLVVTFCTSFISGNVADAGIHVNEWAMRLDEASMRVL
jgi:hypothetical protein